VITPVGILRWKLDMNGIKLKFDALWASSWSYIIPIMQVEREGNESCGRFTQCHIFPSNCHAITKM